MVREPHHRLACISVQRSLTLIDAKQRYVILMLGLSLACPSRLADLVPNTLHACSLGSLIASGFQAWDPPGQGRAFEFRPPGHEPHATHSPAGCAMCIRLRQSLSDVLENSTPKPWNVDRADLHTDATYERTRQFC